MLVDYTGGLISYYSRELVLLISIRVEAYVRDTDALFIILLLNLTSVPPTVVDLVRYSILVGSSNYLLGKIACVSSVTIIVDIFK